MTRKNVEWHIVRSYLKFKFRCPYMSFSGTRPHTLVHMSSVVATTVAGLTALRWRPLWPTKFAIGAFPENVSRSWSVQLGSWRLVVTFSHAVTWISWIDRASDDWEAWGSREGFPIWKLGFEQGVESGDILPEAPGDPNRCETACLVGSGFHRREGGQSFHSEAFAFTAAVLFN